MPAHGTTTTRYIPVQVTGLLGVTTIGGGYNHTIALKADGTAWGWGSNGYGQLGDGTTTTRYTPVQVAALFGATNIATGSYHTIAVVPLKIWSDNLTENSPIRTGQAFTAALGSAQYTWSLAAGSLPLGITLNPSGVISGIPTASGTYNFTVIVANNTGLQLTQSFTLVVTLPSVRIPGVITRYFNLLQDAYDAVSNGETIDLYGIDFNVNINFVRDVSVLLKGGYDDNFSSVSRYTNIHGSITVTNGTVIVDNLIIMP